MIQGMDELKKIEGMGNVDRQVVIIYHEDEKSGIGELGIRANEVKAGRSLSERIDLIELEDEVDMDEMIKRIESHPIVLEAEKNGTAKTMPHE